MNIINKKDLAMTAGFLVVKATGQVLDLPHLAYEANEIGELRDLNEFVNTNRAKIEASASKPIEYRPARPAVPAFAQLEKPATPITDAEVEQAKAKALEFLDVRNVEDTNVHLARYTELAKWFDSDYVTDRDTPFAPNKFTVDILKLTAQEVIDTVVAFNEPEMIRLRNMLVFPRD